MNFQPDLFTGRFTYAVPIEAPPARQNSQPKIVLGYNSSFPNGWCGVGWSLDMGTIQRETKCGVPVQWGPTGPLGQYDNSKGFIFTQGGSSSSLVWVGGNEYRQQVDGGAFLKFNLYTNYWVLTDKNGTRFFFGEGSTNRLENPKWTACIPQSTFLWALDRVLDANGNETCLSYTNAGSQLYLSHVGYNANVNSPSLPASDTVDFILENRCDTNSNYRTNFKIQNNERLSQIVVKNNGNKVRRYALAYTKSPSTSRSLLTSITQFGSDDTTSLPPLTFTYQQESFAFGPVTNWPGLTNVNPQDPGWSGVNAYSTNNGNNYTLVRLVDIDGDGLPDRVMRQNNGPYSSFVVQRNTGTNFEGAYSWSGLNAQGISGLQGGSIGAQISDGNGGFSTSYELLDITGNGRPARVMTNSQNRTTWLVQTNNGLPGTNSFSPAMIWTNIQSLNNDLYHVSVNNSAGETMVNNELIDLNGDGLPDRLIVSNSNYYIQLNTGNGFTEPVEMSNCYGYPLMTWFPWSDYSEQLTAFVDMNGDGLPDFVVGYFSTNYEVFFNNGAGFEPPEYNSWGPVLNADGTVVEYPNMCDIERTELPESFEQWDQIRFIDINGDGLPDRVLWSSQPHSYAVQLNTGSGFSPLTTWDFSYGMSNSPPSTWGTPRYVSNGATCVDFIDINGDGLPDRVMRSTNPNDTSIKVQLNLGPYPDLLSAASNGVGGKVEISYVPSTKYDNTGRPWTNSPWAEGAKSLLPSPVHTVSAIVVDDGMGNRGTNSYTYKHGMFDPVRKEFRGFNCAQATDPAGVRTLTYFHQGGGFDDSANGEYLDPGSFAKKGMPYRVETWGTNGLLYNLVLNKVIEYELNANGWFFPCVAQTILMDYEGLGGYRATARQFSYDTNTENLVAEANLGEVANVVFNGQTFTDTGSDSVFKWIGYTNIGGGILNKSSDVTITSDSAGQNRLRELRLNYDGCGNLAGAQVWLDTAGAFIPEWSGVHDQYGNLVQSTDAAGITTTNIYDSTFKQYPVTEQTASFTSQATYDARCGKVTTATDAKGLVSSNSYDVFFRPIAAYVSTNAYGPPALWQSRTYYALGGIKKGASLNCLHSQVNNAIGAVNGYETYSYCDGLGRQIETRAESETGQFRVADSLYNNCGKRFYETLPYFSAGTNFTPLNSSYLGVLTEYDSIGRAFRQTPSVQAAFNSSGQLQTLTATGGDSGSPVGLVTTAFLDAANPWATVVTDSAGKVKKTYRDAYARTTLVTEVTTNGNVNTTYSFDLLGNLTNVTDNANNPIVMTCDSLGRKTGMADADMGGWGYQYDNAGRLTQQTDARTNRITFQYNDPLGRLTSKQIYNCSNALVGTVSFAYDTSDDPNYTVFKGQLYKVTDLQGYQRSSYDARGRVLESGRFLSVNGIEYVTQATYDDANRLRQLTYPGNSATIQYSYDTSGHTTQVKSLSGTGTNETFYTTLGFNALDQPSGYTSGNGVNTAYSYYPNSSRLLTLSAAEGGTNIQNLSYTYDPASQIKSINDAVYTGAASASVNNIVYDDLYRLVSLNSSARGQKSYAYDSIGNLLTNLDFGSGGYQYGPKPHAVTSANGVSYGYDTCGNMITRGSQRLSFDCENQLVRVTTTNDSVSFGYDESGERLWRCGTNGYTIWIGGLYEVNNGKVLCHVVADGQLVATFEPQCTAGMSKLFGEKNWYAASMGARSWLDWPFQRGRTRWTVLAGAWVGVWILCLMAARSIRLRGSELRGALRWRCLWRQAVTFLSCSAILMATTVDVEAVTYRPVFYYYHPDHLGSSSVLTDRSGNVVQQYGYATFGQVAYSANASAFPISNRYTGQIADDETGLYYYGGRYYDPQLGRFIQPDPFIPDPSSSQSFNRFSYCQNNPLNGVDPSGFQDDGPPTDDSPPDDSGNVPSPSIPSAQNWNNNWNNFVLFYAPPPAPPPPTSAQFFLGDAYVPPTYADFNTPDYGGFPPLDFSGFPGGPSPHDEGGWLSTVTKVAGWVSAVPGPVGTVAGGINAIGELLQGNYGAAAWAVGGALAATVGAGFAVKAVAVARAAREAKMVETLAVDAAKITKAAEGTALREGSFSIADWSGYPANVPKPTGPFRLLEGAEYDAARAEANAANRALHQADPSLNGLQLHEIQPVKFGGSPTDPLNKIPLTPQQHAPVTTWWNQLQRDITP